MAWRGLREAVRGRQNTGSRLYVDEAPTACTKKASLLRPAFMYLDTSWPRMASQSPDTAAMSSSTSASSSASSCAPPPKAARPRAPRQPSPAVLPRAAACCRVLAPPAARANGWAATPRSCGGARCGRPLSLTSSVFCCCCGGALPLSCASRSVVSPSSASRTHAGSLSAYPARSTTCAYDVPNVHHGEHSAMRAWSRLSSSRPSSLSSC